MPFKTTIPLKLTTQSVSYSTNAKCEPGMGTYLLAGSREDCFIWSWNELSILGTDSKNINWLLHFSEVQVNYFFVFRKQSINSCAAVTQLPKLFVPHFFPDIKLKNTAARSLFLTNVKFADWSHWKLCSINNLTLVTCNLLFLPLNRGAIKL